MSRSKQQDDDMRGALAECEMDLAVHCKTFHEERFSRPWSRGHCRLFEVINDPTIQKLLVIAHRGFGKTSIFNYALPSQHIVFQKSRYIVPVSATSMQAEMQSENLKMELLSNVKIRQCLGEIKSKDKFSKEMWVTNNGTAVMPRGAGQQIRGILYRNWRPDLIIFDDLETPELVMSKEQRDKTKVWAFADMFNCPDLSESPTPKYRIIGVGTVLHESALLQDLKDDSSWTTIEMSLCDENFKSYWPTFMSDESVTALADDFRRQGKVEVFYREFMNIANPIEDAVFRTEYFKYYEEHEMDFLTQESVQTVVIVDPAKTAKVHSAYTAIVGISFDVMSNNIYIRDVVNKRLYPEQIYDEAIAMVQRLNACVLGVEVTSLEEFIVQPLKNEISKRGLGIELVELKARSASLDGMRAASSDKGKIGRVGALAPYYRMGHVYHNKNSCGPLEAQLLAYPRPRHWDVMDATAYIVELMEKADQYFLLKPKEEEWVDTQEQVREDRIIEKMMEEDEDAVDLWEYSLV